MRAAYYIVSILLYAVIQTTVFPGIWFLYAKPIILLVFPLIVTLRRGLVEGSIIAVACGLVMDILGTQTVGVNALIFLQICFFTGIIVDKFFVDKFFVIMVFVFVASTIYSLLYFALMFLIWGNGHIFPQYIQKDLIGCLYSGAISMPIYALYKINDNWLTARRGDKYNG